MTVTIRPQQPAERPAVRRVVMAAFAGEVVVADLVERLQDDSLGEAVISLVAEEAGEIVGHVQLSRSWVDAREALVDVLVLSPLSVLPGRQRQGIGGLLVRAALEAAAEAGSPLVFLEGDPAVYRGYGFERASGRGFTRPSLRIPDAACQVVVLDAWEDWMTGALVYNDVFWALDAVGLRGEVLERVERSLGER